MQNKFPILDDVYQSYKNSDELDKLKDFLKIVSECSNDVAVLDRVGYMQSELKDYNNCIFSLMKCYNFAENDTARFAIRANTAKMLNHVNDPIGSLFYSRANADQQFDYDTMMEMAFSYYLVGDYETSEQMMRELYEDKNLPEQIRGRVEYNLGSYDISRGEFKKGLRGFVDIGHKIKIWHRRTLHGVPEWNGEPLPGKTLLISAEGGIGDEIINVRFTENIKKLGMHPVWITSHEDLQSVFNGNGIKATVDTRTLDPSNAVHCMAMYLPILLDLDKDQLWNGAYLRPSKEYLDKWEALLPAGKKLAVKWSGNPMYDQDLHRSIPVEYIKDIPYEGTKINLQLEPEYYQDDMFNAGEHIKTIEDTLAILWLCDDLVTSCTSIAHMNGSMGKRGIVCPPIACYYVWLGDAVWYDSMTVVRQYKHKSWSEVFEQVNELVKTRN